jgi:excisionase family DNA binding protein
MIENDRIAYRPEEFARSIGMSRRYIYKEIKDGRLPSRKLGRARVIRSTDAEKWLQKQPRG